MISLDITIELRVTRRQHVWLHPNTVQELKERRGKIALRSAANPADISVHGQPLWQTILSQETHNCIKGGFGMKILMHLGPEQTGRARVHNVQRFDGMLAFPLRLAGIQSSSAHIFEIDLHFLHEVLYRQGSPFALFFTLDESRLVEDLPDGASGSRQAQATQT